MISPEIQDVLERYDILLREVDAWFASCLERHADAIQCGKGCSSCCRGLFDITLLDALFLKSGFDALPEETRQALQYKALQRLNGISKNKPAFIPPWLLTPIPESEWDDILPDEDETPCVLLSSEGSCLVYHHRPMTCRLNGIPMTDISGERIFDEWCTLNFINADPLSYEDLRHSFRDLFAQELLLFREITRRLLGSPVNELDTIIPAAILLDDRALQQIRSGCVRGEIA